MNFTLLYQAVEIFPLLVALQAFLFQVLEGDRLLFFYELCQKDFLRLGDNRAIVAVVWYELSELPRCFCYVLDWVALFTFGLH